MRFSNLTSYYLILRTELFELIKDRVIKDRVKNIDFCFWISYSYFDSDSLTIFSESLWSLDGTLVEAQIVRLGARSEPLPADVPSPYSFSSFTSWSILVVPDAQKYLHCQTVK